jgi:phosphatidylglycerophosphate synthase
MDLEKKITKEKGASDFLAYYIHQPVENKLVSYLMNTRVTPNQVTVATNIVAYTVTFLYLIGWLLEGSILSFIVGIMDGIDGKLARAKDMSTNLGKLEHAFDLLYEFSWIIALSLILTQTTGSSMPLLYGLSSVVIISFYRMVYDTFGRAVGMSLDNYASFERVFRRVAGRRNLYNIHILAFILLSKPELCLTTITVHAMITAIIYTIRVGYHLNKMDNLEK